MEISRKTTRFIKYYFIDEETRIFFVMLHNIQILRMNRRKYE